MSRRADDTPRSPRRGRSRIAPALLAGWGAGLALALAVAARPVPGQQAPAPRELERELVAAATAGDAAAAEQAARALLAAEPARLERLLARHREPAVRWVALEALLGAAAGAAGPPAAAPQGEAAARAANAIRTALADRDERLVLRAARAARVHRAPELLAPLVEALGRAERVPAEQSWLASEITAILQELTGQQLGQAAAWRAWLRRHGTEPPPLLPPPPDAPAGAGGSGADEPELAGSAAATIPRRLARRPGAQQLLERLSARDLVVVRGKYDQAEEVLAELGLPFTPVERPRLGEAALDGEQVLIFNCSDVEEEPTPAAGIQRVRQAAEAGAWLLSSDWEAANLIARAFPGHIQLGPRTRGDQRLVIAPAPGMALHPLMRDVFPISPLQLARWRWRIDDDTWTVIPTRQSLVLLTCPELEAQTGHGTVALSFPVGRRGGRVLHVLSHYTDESAGPEGGYVLQQLIVNFVLEKQRLRAAAGTR
ncbi:MAG: hypothetical protein KatS3mg102_2368 [Planctomycetota bacterium]|nr:MAG: hypothetical protein KatS3mg102_2368 [Planctomycetota bacterium]